MFFKFRHGIGDHRFSVKEDPRFEFPRNIIRQAVNIAEPTPQRMVFGQVHHYFCTVNRFRKRLHVSFVNKLPGHLKRRLYQADFRIFLACLEVEYPFDVPLVVEGSNVQFTFMFLFEFCNDLFPEKPLLRRHHPNEDRHFVFRRLLQRTRGY